MNAKPDPIALTTKPLGTPVYTCSVFTRGDLMSQRWFLYTLYMHNAFQAASKRGR